MKEVSALLRQGILGLWVGCSLATRLENRLSDQRFLSPPAPILSLLVLFVLFSDSRRGRALRLVVRRGPFFMDSDSADNVLTPGVAPLLLGVKGSPIKLLSVDLLILVGDTLRAWTIGALFFRKSARPLRWKRSVPGRLLTGRSSNRLGGLPRSVSASIPERRNPFLVVWRGVLPLPSDSYGILLRVVPP